MTSNVPLGSHTCATPSLPFLHFPIFSSGVKVQNVYEELIINAAQGLEIMKTGVKKRITAATNCNEKSR